MCTIQNQNLRGGWGKLVLVYFHVMTIIDPNVKPWFSWSYVHQVSYLKSAVNPIKPHFPMVTIMGHELAVWSSFNPGIFGGTILLILVIQSKTQLVLRKCAFVGSLWRETWPCTKPLPCSASNGLPIMIRIVIAQVSPVKKGVANPKPRKGCHVRGATSFWRPTSGRCGNTIRACTQTTSMSWMCQRTGGNGVMRGGASIWHRQSRKNLLQAQGLAGVRQGQGESAAKLVVKKRVARSILHGYFNPGF